MAGAVASSAEAAQVRIDRENDSLTLSLVKVHGAEYLPLASLTKAVGNSPKPLLTGRSYRIQLGKSSLSVTVGSPKVRMGKSVILLSDPPRKLGGGVVVPLELLPIALGVRYGEGRINWDPEARVVRIAQKAYSLSLLRFRTYQDHTRIVLEGTRSHDFILRDDGASGRVVLEVKRGTVSPAIRFSQVSDGLVASVETQQLGSNSQITIHGAGRRLRSKAFAMGEPDRIVVDLFPIEEQVQNSRQVDALAKATPKRGDQAKPATRGVEPPELSAASSPEPIVRTVVIDPGHGGRDSGAIGPSGAMEKDIVLDVGFKLQRLIEENLGMKVIMTRTEDVFVPLESRTMIANRHRADFFISLHVNAAPGSRAVGFETYFLSREPSDRGAKASAVRENTALNLEGVGQDAQRGLKTVLWDLTQTFYVRESSELAELLLNELGQSLGVDNRGVKSAPFFVLIGAAMPSVLVEVAFITNPQEERKLEQEAYRQQVAEALLAGIAQFKARYEKRVGLMPESSTAIARPTKEKSVQPSASAAAEGWIGRVER
ncbi:N-acetylmuramoyl-L-alanine amidase [Candidatus Methylomirabilis sp.]|uniref:N-acetylmuramoyl-L-alanine amidase n=1 Tax=Candidatus Methylomirabilis sp. TaxID=2032687 RepID=UPI002A618A5C|nr:N-acetylmuramoyl-L-alanine amidase [Candidatus Methylomirabilis sp.]